MEGRARPERQAAPDRGRRARRVERIPIDGIKGPGLPSRAIVVLPSQLSDATSIDVLLHLHGFAPLRHRRQDPRRLQIEAQMAAAGKELLGILPQGSGNSDFNGARAGKAFDADAFIAAVFARLVAEGYGVPGPGRVIMSSHSGGDQPLAETLKRKPPEKLRRPVPVRHDDRVGVRRGRLVLRGRAPHRRARAPAPDEARRPGLARGPGADGDLDPAERVPADGRLSQGRRLPGGGEGDRDRTSRRGSPRRSRSSARSSSPRCATTTPCTRSPRPHASGTWTCSPATTRCATRSRRCRPTEALEGVPRDARAGRALDGMDMPQLMRLASYAGNHAIRAPARPRRGAAAHRSPPRRSR